VLGSSFADDGANDLDPNVAPNAETSDETNDAVNHAGKDEHNLPERRQGAGAGSD
jgi:hypothetical protein